VVLAREAGGRVTGFDGSPFELASDEVLASNSLLHQELMREFQQIFAGRVEGLPQPAEFLARRK